MGTTERMEVTEYLDGNGQHELTLQCPIFQLRGVWVDENRGFAKRTLTPIKRFNASASLVLASGAPWPVGRRNVKVVYWADVPVETGTCELCKDEGTLICSTCNGSGEGMYDGSTCRTCKGKGEVPCECKAESMEDARAAAEDAAYEAYKDRRKYGRLA